MPPAMIAVWVCHALKCFYPGIDMLNNRSIPRKPLIMANQERSSQLPPPKAAA
jgi:hypothetical protein